MCDKIKVKDSAARVVEGTLSLHDEVDGGVSIEVEGAEQETHSFKSLFKEYDGKAVTIRIAYAEQLTSDALENETI